MLLTVAKAPLHHYRRKNHQEPSSTTAVQAHSSFSVNSVPGSSLGPELADLLPSSPLAGSCGTSSTCFSGGGLTRQHSPGSSKALLAPTTDFLNTEQKTEILSCVSLSLDLTLPDSHLGSTRPWAHLETFDREHTKSSQMPPSSLHTQTSFYYTTTLQGSMRWFSGLHVSFLPHAMPILLFPTHLSHYLTLLLFFFFLINLYRPSAFLHTLCDEKEELSIGMDNNIDLFLLLQFWSSNWSGDTQTFLYRRFYKYLYWWFLTSFEVSGTWHYQRFLCIRETDVI